MPKMHNFRCRYDSLLLYEELSTINQWASAFNGLEKDGKKKKTNRVEQQFESYHSSSIETTNYHFRFYLYTEFYNPITSHKHPSKHK